MADPLKIEFQADTSRAQSAMASLAASIIANTASSGVALSGMAANSNRTGDALGALSQNVRRAASAVGSDVTKIASATAAAATKEKATLEGVVASFTAAAATSQTAQAGVKAGIQGTGAAIAGLASQLPILTTLAAGVAGVVLFKVALDAVAAAAGAASQELDRMAKVGNDAARLGVSSSFLQTYTAQARSLKLEADDLTKSLEKAKGAFTVQQGEGGADARNQSSFEARLRQQAGAGNATAGQVSRFAGASGLEAQYRAALDIITEIQSKGREVAALDLASKIFPPNVVDRIRAGTLDMDKFRKSIDDIKNPDLILISPDEIVRAQELQRRLQDAQNTLDNAARDFNVELGRAGVGLREDAIAWKELMASGARIAVGILQEARKIRQDMTANEPAIYGRDYFRPEDAPKSGLQKDLGPPRATIPSTGDKDRDDALNQLRTGLTNPTLIDQAGRASRAMSDAVGRPDRSNTIRTDKAKKESSSSSEMDAIETFTNQLQKQAAALKAEAEAFNLSNSEKAVAIALAKANEIASQNGTKLTEAQTSAIKKAAEETSRYKDSLQDLEQRQRQAAEASRFFGQMAADSLGDAILEGKSFSNILTDLSKQISRAALNAVFTGQGPLASLLGTAPAASSGGSVGGLAKIAQEFFGGFKANGGPVEAGQAYTVGERGREMFIPNSNGQIVPIMPGGSGGSGNFNVTINEAPGGDKASTRMGRRSDGSPTMIVEMISRQQAADIAVGRGPLADVSPGARRLRG